MSCIVLLWAVGSLYAHDVVDTLGYYVSEQGDTIKYQYAPQEQTSPADSSKKTGLMNFIEGASRFFMPDTSRHKKITYLVIPEFSYSDRSGIGIGGSARMYIRNFKPLPTGESRRLSYIDASVDFSFNGDMSFSISPEFYMKEDKDV